MKFTNWKTTLSGIAAAIVLILTFLASQPYSNGELAQIIPSEWKPYLALAGIVSAGILAVIRGLASADATSVTVLTNEVKALQEQLKKTLADAEAQKAAAGLALPTSAAPPKPNT